MIVTCTCARQDARLSKCNMFFDMHMSADMVDTLKSRSLPSSNNTCAFDPLCKHAHAYLSITKFGKQTVAAEHLKESCIAYRPYPAQARLVYGPSLRAVGYQLCNTMPALLAARRLPSPMVLSCDACHGTPNSLSAINACDGHPSVLNVLRTEAPPAVNPLLGLKNFVDRPLQLQTAHPAIIPRDQHTALYATFLVKPHSWCVSP
eukprot:scaffold15691_cov21-Tisochrysis_lutea.AAC.1